MATYFLQALGCKVSQYDGQRLAEHLQTWGLTPAPEGAAPDLYILNSCAVTVRAAQKARQALHAVRRKWPETKIILAGCEAKSRDLGEADSGDADGVLLPGASVPQIAELLRKLGFEKPSESLEAPIHHPMASARTRAFLKIQDGCNQFCSYCIVPHLRGRETSKPFEVALAEAEQLVNAGYREIVMTGIHLGKFEYGLVPLLRQMEIFEGIDRLRLSSIEPLEVGDDLIDWLATSPKACRHLHLPLQAGEDRLLKEMNRPYSTDEFLAVVRRVRAKIPEIALTTDFIVGFPGESDEQFAEGLRFVEQIGFSRMHIFRYSPRPGTSAASRKDHLDGRVKKARAEQAEALWRRMAENYHRRFVGRELEVLWETCENGVWQGVSREYIPVRWKTALSGLQNRLTRVPIVSADADGVTAQPPDGRGK